MAATYHPLHRAFKDDPWRFDFDPKELLEKYRAERDRRIRTDFAEQFITIGEGKGAKYADWLVDPWVQRVERPALDIQTTVLIVGGGFSGIQVAGNLKKAGITDFKIMDRAGDFGGTWYWNRYPGAACDSEAYGYLPLLEEMQYMPTAKYVTGTEILQHCWRMAKQFGIYENALFHTAAKEFVWDEAASVWRATTDRGDKITTRFLITCGGPLAHPHLPDVPGIDTFKGDEWHTSRWNYAKSGGDPLKLDFNMTKLKDKRVGIIGTGATAIQCVSFLGESSGKLYVFQRTPSAVDVRDNKPTDPKWWASLPKGWQAERDRNFHRNAAGADISVDLDDGFSLSLAALGELQRRQIRFGEGKQYGMAELRQLADLKLMESIRRRVDEVVKDKKTAELLKPYYNLFCKRPAYSDTYLPTFNRPNVELVDCSSAKGIERITPTGVVVAGKEYPLDVIIWSTGFTAPIADYVDYRILGKDGLTKREKWDKQGGMATLYGICTNGFPNAFNFGSYQAGASVNFPSALNVIGVWITHVVSEAVKRGIQVLEVTRDAEEEWVKEVIKRSRRDVTYFENCTPGYYNREGFVTTKTTPSQSREVTYGGSPLRYKRELEQYAAKNDLAGFTIKYLPGRAPKL
ncbi:putative monooxygenase [Hyaloraphidium curvatum]|nr:putative monooxygenase [Hyaloraphidium curvatum]